MTDTAKWTTIAVRKITHVELKNRKKMKPHGVPENMDDVIRRETGMPPVEKPDIPEPVPSQASNPTPSQVTPP